MSEAEAMQLVEQMSKDMKARSSLWSVSSALAFLVAELFFFFMAALMKLHLCNLSCNFLSILRT